MKKLLYLILFFVVNFVALGIGSMISANDVTGSWYMGLEKAPWTPPGWFFGFAWTTIMILFSVFMTELVLKKEKFDKQLIMLFSLQWVINVGWNYIFFEKHLVTTGLITISVLLLLIIWFAKEGFRSLKGYYPYLILPYAIWLAVATSLNAFILIYN